MSSIKMPKIIESYIQASNDNNRDNFIQCFSSSATVLDEGETLVGHEAIGKWFTSTRTKYKFKCEPLAIDERGDDFLLTAKVSGNFPGSPVTLDYNIKVIKSKIQDLRIT